MSRAAPLPADERRAAIIAATEPLLEVRGRNVSTRQLAEAAGVAEGTLFRVFRSKEALIDAVVDEVLDPRVICDALADIELDEPLEQRLVRAVGMLQERLRRGFALFHVLALGPPDRHDVGQRARHRHDNELLNAALAKLIEPDRDALRFDPEEAASLLLVLTFTSSHPILSDLRHSEPQQIVDILLYGITARPNAKEEPAC